MNQHGNGAFPSYNTLAESASLGRSTVIKHMDMAVEKGWIRKRVRPKGNMDNETNMYEISFPLVHLVDQGGIPGGLASPSGGPPLVHHVDPNTPVLTPQLTQVIRKTASQGSHLPEDWVPSDEDVDFCKTERPDLDPEKVAEEFRDYWIAKPGKDGRKSNWSATWRNWVRRQRQQDVKSEIKPKEQAWWASDQGILAKAAQIGLTPRSGESWHDLKGRINQRLGQ